MVYNQGAFAQQANRQIILKLTDPATQISQTYQISNTNYTYAKLYDDSQKKDQEACKVNMELKQDMDQFLLKWISGALKETEGLITIKAAGPGKRSRTIAFKGGKVATGSESFMIADSSSYPVMSLYVRELIIDNVSVFSIPKEIK